MNARNILYAQSGGPTAVINTTAAGLISAAQSNIAHFGRIFAAKNGILGVLAEQLLDITALTTSELRRLSHTPGAAFGACRYKLPHPTTDSKPYERILAVLRAHDIGYFFYNGGGDSHDTIHKISQYCQQHGHPICCIGLPKTIDNDLAITDHSPGYGSAAKYIAISTQEIACDLASMAVSSTKVFVYEVMGRHAGWLAAASALARRDTQAAPHLILMPEVAFRPDDFLKQVEAQVKTHGHCMIVASEGLRDTNGKLVSELGGSDDFGHHQLGGLAAKLAKNIKAALGYKYHWCAADYCQRAACHAASQTDYDEAFALGQAAITEALAGTRDKMLTLERTSSQPYTSKIGLASLADVANIEACLPQHFISDCGYDVTPAAIAHMQPLIQGECRPSYQHGLPEVYHCQASTVRQRCCEYSTSE